jgi:hypothetical protein
LSTVVSGQELIKFSVVCRPMTDHGTIQTAELPDNGRLMSQLAIAHPEQSFVDYSYQICPNRRAAQIRLAPIQTLFILKPG